jgi:uncharacterized protein
MLHTTKVRLMDEYLGFALFFLIFIAIYILLNYFVLLQFYKLFNIEKNYLFYIILIVLGLSYIVAAGLESYSDNSIFRTTYILASVWMGMLFLSFCALALYHVIDRFVPITTWITGIIIVCIILLATIYSIMHAYSFKIKEMDIYNDKDADIKIVQISDVHLGVINGKSYLKHIVDKINGVHPDVVLITGDLFDGRYHYDKDILHVLNDINASVYFSSGNHDEYTNLSIVKELLKDTKVKWLRNEVAEYKGIYIIGLDDTRDSKNVGARLYALNMSTDLSKKYTILMNHRPIGWKDASKYVDLMLSGHTHAGQLWPFNYLTVVEGNAMSGVHKIPHNERFMLYASPGTGTWGPPMRLGSDTEITVFNIHSKK